MPKNNYGANPRMIVVIGDQVVFASHVSMNMTNKSESDTATITIPLDNIDANVFTKTGVVVEVEIYVGYIDYRIDKNVNLKKDLINKGLYKTNKNFFKRFHGYARQPEFAFGDENVLTLECVDAIGLLSDGKFSEKMEGASTSVSSILKYIKPNLTGLTIDYKGVDFKLGTQDKKSKKWSYNISNKSYFDVLKDIAMYGQYDIIKEHNKITIGPQQATKSNYTMVKTGSKNPDDDWPTFTNLRIRHGKSGGKSKDSILVEVYGISPTSERGKSKKVLGRYPADSKGWDGSTSTEVIRLNWKQPIDQKTANEVAKQIGETQLKNFVTGDVSCPFADPRIMVDDGISFYADLNLGLDFLRGKIFRISSIKETFDMGGYGQEITFESNPRFEQPKLTAPTYNKQEAEILNAIMADERTKASSQGMTTHQTSHTTTLPQRPVGNK